MLRAAFYCCFLCYSQASNPHLISSPYCLHFSSESEWETPALENWGLSPYLQSYTDLVMSSCNSEGKLVFFFGNCCWGAIKKGARAFYQWAFTRQAAEKCVRVGDFLFVFKRKQMESSNINFQLNPCLAERFQAPGLAYRPAGWNLTVALVPGKSRAVLPSCMANSTVTGTEFGRPGTGTLGTGALGGATLNPVNAAAWGAERAKLSCPAAV